LEGSSIQYIYEDAEEKMKIKFWQIVAVLMVAAMILAACGPKATPTVAPTEAKEPV